MFLAILSLLVSIGISVILIRAYVYKSFSFVLALDPNFIIVSLAAMFLLYIVCLLAINFKNRLAELLHVLSVVMFIPMFIMAYALAYDNIQWLAHEREPLQKIEKLCESGTECIYFSVVTFTTLGYGDIIPKTDYSKILTSSQAFLGFLFVPILVTQFLSIVKDFKE